MFENQKYQLSPDWNLRTEQFGALLYNIPTGGTLLLNHTGRQILELIVACAPALSDLDVLLRKNFGLSAEGELVPIRKFISTLASAQVIQARDAELAAPVRNQRVRPEQASRSENLASHDACVLSAPITVWWDVTSACNLKCKQCYSSSGRALRDELTTLEACRLVDELAELGVFSIYFLGGEPLMRRDFYDIVQRAVKNGLRVMISTNGWLVSDRAANRLAELGVHHVRVSLDGATPQMHDRIRGMAGSWERAIAAIKALKRAGLPMVGVGPTMMQENFSECEDLIGLAVDLGADEIQLGQLCNVGRGEAIVPLSGAQIAVMRSIIARKTRDLRGRLRISSPEGTWDDKPHLKAAREGAITPNLMGCGGGRSVAAISSTGQVRCCLLYDLPVGNVRHSSFKELWYGDHPNLRWLRSVKEGCNGCRNSKICAGPCPMEKTTSCDERREFVAGQCQANCLSPVSLAL